MSHSSHAPTKSPPRQQPKRAAIASVMGGALEYYDFALFASAAAIIFPKLFFHDSEAAVLASFATFGAAYLARPLGAIIISHIGDRQGRKHALLLTISLMGVATFLIGCLPTYDTIGILAPVLLVTLRLVQGFSAGGELAGASSLTMEHAPEGRRAFVSSFSLVGVGIGMVMANAIMIPITALPDDILYTWGWRLPFWLSAVVLVIGIWVRRSLDEPEAFENAETSKAPPFIAVFRENPQGVIRVALCNLFAVVQTVTTVFGLSYAIQQGVNSTTMVAIVTASQFISIFARPLCGLAADRFGRKPVFIFGAASSGLLIFPFFSAIASGNVFMIAVSMILLTGVAISFADGAYPAFFSEMFNAKIRYTGMAIGLQIGILLSGFSPTIGRALQGEDTANWIPVAIMTAACSAIAVLAALTAKETFRTPLEHLGTKNTRAEASTIADPDKATIPAS